MVSPSSAFNSLRSRLKPKAQTRLRWRLPSLRPSNSKSQSFASHHQDSCTPIDGPSLIDGMPIAKNGKLIAVRLVPKNYPSLDTPRTDSGSIYSDAVGEPLVNDATSDVIPISVRPLMNTRGSIDSASDAASDFASKMSETTYDIEPDTPVNSERVHSAPASLRSVICEADSFQDATHLHKRAKSLTGSVLTSSLSDSARDGSSVESTKSTATDPSVHALPPLQAKSWADDFDRLDPVLEDDPKSFELVSPPPLDVRGFSVERRAEEMFSRAHLAEIFADPSSMLRFTSFLSNRRPNSIPLLIYYLDAVKSLKAIKYANSIVRSLAPIEGHSFTDTAIEDTTNPALEKRAQEAFDALVNEDLPAYISDVFMQVVNLSLRRRVTGTMPAHLRDASEGLAEVFCLTDPSRKDNPVVFASEEFHRTTQYGVDYTIGRNCRFLQGPDTSKDSVRRLREAISRGKEVNEVFINYRRDGSPFMNLLTVDPLFDSRGNIRYFLGAQVDVTGLCKDCTDLDSLKKLLEKRECIDEDEPKDVADSKQDLQYLSEMLNDEEVEVVKRCGGRMHSQSQETDESHLVHRSRIHVRDLSNEHKPSLGYQRLKPGSIFQNYLLVRPHPSLRILFASSALRTPGILQSPLLSRIGGSTRVREELSAALESDRGVTAKVRWVSGRPGEEEGRARWVHCTPLLGSNGVVGVWMVVIVDEEGYEPVRRFKMAPPVAADIAQAVESTSRPASKAGFGRRHSEIVLSRDALNNVSLE